MVILFLPAYSRRALVSYWGKKERRVNSLKSFLRSKLVDYLEKSIWSILFWDSLLSSVYTKPCCNEKWNRGVQPCSINALVQSGYGISTVSCRIWKCMHLQNSVNQVGMLLEVWLIRIYNCQPCYIFAKNSTTRNEPTCLKAEMGRVLCRIHHEKGC